MKPKVGIFYGSTTGITEQCAEDIHTEWMITGIPIAEPEDIGRISDLNELLQYDYLLIGIPTWNIGELQDDWDAVFDELDDLDFSGKIIAIFGEGDQLNYPDNYLDAVGILGRKLQDNGASLVGYWSTEGYEHYESLAIEGDHFMGLALDNTNQTEKTEERIKAWIPQVMREFALKSVDIQE